MKKLIAILLAALMICGVLAGCGSSSGSSSGGSTPTTEPTTTTAAQDPTTEPTTDPVNEPVADNADYEEIFSSRNIVTSPVLFLGLDSMSFAMADEASGMVEKIDLGYKDDIVNEMVNTVYYPLGEMTDDEKTLFDTTMQEAMSAYTGLDCCSDSSFVVGSNYYVITITFSDLDNPDNVLMLETLGLIEADSTSGLCSASASEASLTVNGYVKK